MNRLRVVLIVALLSTGCAFNSEFTTSQTIWDVADSYASMGQYEKAWDALTRTPPDMTARTQNYLDANPSIYAAANDYFSVDKLRTKKSENHDSTYAYKKLDDFERFAKKSDLRRAEKNIKNVYGERNASSLATKVTLPVTKYGRIASVQVINRSRINTGGGAQLGAVTGQVMYLDKTNWGNYSAMNQLGSGLVGAMVGSALDSPTKISYEIKYWVTLNNGDTITVTKLEKNTTHIPERVCVAVASDSSIEPVNEAKCKAKF